jgi:vacuolar-type H+-ATPase subunit F/Vma7
VKVRVVGDKILVGMFRLAGVPGSTPSSFESTGAAIDAYLREPDVGVVLVGSSYAAGMGARFRPYLQRRKLPMVLRIPDRQDQEGCAGEIREHLQRTLGIRL